MSNRKKEGFPPLNSGPRDQNIGAQPNNWHFPEHFVSSAAFTSSSSVIPGDTRIFSQRSTGYSPFSLFSSVILSYLFCFITQSLIKVNIFFLIEHRSKNGSLAKGKFKHPPMHSGSTLHSLHCFKWNGEKVNHIAASEFNSMLPLGRSLPRLPSLLSTCAAHFEMYPCGCTNQLSTGIALQ